MKRSKQLFFPLFITLGMSVFGACGGDRGNSSTNNDTQDNGNATGTMPEGDNTMGTDTMDMRDSNMYDQGTTDSLGRQDTSGQRQ